MQSDRDENITPAAPQQGDSGVAARSTSPQPPEPTSSGQAPLSRERIAQELCCGCYEDFACILADCEPKPGKLSSCIALEHHGADADRMIALIKRYLDSSLNDHLCEMKPTYDDSIVGFNEAWDVMRKVFG